MPIRSKISAKQLWKMFYKKYTHSAEIIHFPFHYAKKLSEFEKSNFIDSLTTKGITSKGIEAKTIQMQSFRRKKGKNDWQNSNLTINNRNYNAKLNTLLLALNQCDWYNKIYCDKQVTELSLSLYNANKISYQQLSSVLERPQIKTAKDAHFYSILDQKGEFTKEAQAILLPEFRNTYFLIAPTEEQLKEFKLLISTLPKSEQFFYCLPSIQQGSISKRRSLPPDLPPDKDMNAAIGEDAQFTAFSPPRGSISHGRFKSSSKPRTPIDSFDIIRLTAGARDALGLVRFGLDNYVPTESRLKNRYR